MMPQQGRPVSVYHAILLSDGDDVMELTLLIPDRKLVRRSCPVQERPAGEEGVKSSLALLSLNLRTETAQLYVVQTNRN